MSLYVGDRLVCRFGWNWFGWVEVLIESRITRIEPRCTVNKT